MLSLTADRYRRRQYISQFQKWDIHKYNNKHDEDAVNSRICQRNLGWSSSSGGDEASSKHESSSASSYDQRPCLLLGSRLDERHDSPLLGDSSTADTKLGDSSPLCSVLTQDSSSNGTQMSREQQEQCSSMGCEGLDVVEEDCQRLSHPRAIDWMEIDTAVPSAQSDLGRTVSADGPPNQRCIDVNQEIDSFSREEIVEIKRAADFLFAAQCHEDSFTLYVVLLKDMRTSPRVHDDVRTSTIMGCARSATTPSQAEIARALLEQELAKRPIYAHDTRESLIFRSLLANIHGKQGDHDAAQFHNRLATQSSFVQQRSMVPPSQDKNSALDLPIYHCLYRALNCQGKFFAARKIMDQLLRKKPGPFEFENGRMRHSCIRSCLAWCMQKLRKDRMLYGSWRNVEDGKTKYRALCLFCDLWQRWQRECIEPPAARGSLSWASEVEQSMGITPPELLVILCLMMLDAYPTLTAALTESKIVFEQEVPRRALRGGSVLSELCDWDLALAFVRTYSELNSPTEETGCIETGGSSLFQAYVRAFLQDSMQIQLPEVQQSEEAGLSQAISRFNASKPGPNSSTTSLFPTLASSLHSADMSSLRLLKERIQDHVAGLTHGEYEQLPSSVMRDVSMGSLSSLLALSMRGTVQSAQETLETLSSHVRDHVAVFEQQMERIVDGIGLEG
jgi:hypothetical protein